MQDRIDHALFATGLLALALLISLSSAARFPSALRLTNSFAGIHRGSTTAGSALAVR